MVNLQSKVYQQPQNTFFINVRDVIFAEMLIYMQSRGPQDLECQNIQDNFQGINLPNPFPSHNTTPDFSHCDTKRKGSFGLGKLVRDARVYLKSVCESSEEDVKKSSVVFLFTDAVSYQRVSILKITHQIKVTCIT